MVPAHEANCHSFPVSDVGQAHRPCAKIRTLFLNSDAIATGCLPSNGYMDGTTTFKI